MSNKLKTIAGFIAMDPPIVHSRLSYRHPCHQGCKACAYLRERNNALHAVLKLQQEEENKDERQHPRNTARSES